MKNLIGLSGKMGTGKNTVANIIQYLISCKVHGHNITYNDWQITFLEAEKISGWKQKSFAHKVKQVASLLTGIDTQDFESEAVKKAFLGKEWEYNAITKSDTVSEGHGKMTARDMLQKIGTDCMRDKLHPNTWVNALFSEYNTLQLPNWIITDVRFPNEYKSIKVRDGILIRINRKGIPTSDHRSETSLDEFEFDHTIYNDGNIEQLIESVKLILQIENIL